MSNHNLEIALQFGSALDQDNYAAAYALLSEECVYQIGSEIIQGPEAICNSYEANMIEGRAKFDYLEWGKCRVTAVNSTQYLIHFTDHLGHKGVFHDHHCSQKVTLKQGKIIRIDHIFDQSEIQLLNNFYNKVGLPVKS